MYFRLITALLGMLMYASFAHGAPFAYITNLSDNTVSVIDTNTDQYVTKIDLGTGQQPFGVAISADGSRVYVSNKLSKSISVIDALSDPSNPTVINTIGPLSNTPSGLAINPAGTRLYVANNDATSVTVLNVAGLAPNPAPVAPVVVASPTVGTAPVGVAVHPSGTFAYVTNSGGNSVSIIETTNNTVVNTVPVGTNPMGIATGTVGTAVKVFVANYGSNNVSVIDATAQTESTRVTVGSNPYAVAVGKIGTAVKAYVSNSGASGGDTVSVIDTASYTATTPYAVAAGSAPQGISVAPNGYNVYTVNLLGGADHLGSVSAINVNPDVTPAVRELNNATDNADLEFGYFFNSPQSLGNFIGPQLYTISASSGPNGTVSPAGDKLYAINATPAYTLTPAPYYRVDNISIDGTIINKNVANYVKGATTGDPSTYTFSPLNVNHSFDVTFIKDFDYVSVGRVGTATGTITSSPAGLDCSSTSSVCDFLFQEGTVVTLIATPAVGKYFGGWLGDTGRDESGNTVFINNGILCNGVKTVDAQGRGICTFTMSGYTHFNADFTNTASFDKVQVGSTYYSSIQAYFNACSAGTYVTKLALVAFPIETMNLNVAGANVTLSGGWDSNYSYATKGASPTVLQGSLTITAGTVIADGIAIQ